MRLPVLTAPVFLATVCIVSGCSERKSTPMPRPTAYARIEVYDTVYTPAEGVPVNFEVNKSATQRLERSEGDNIWLDVNYPAYNGSFHITFSPVGDTTELRKVIDNRTERMALNLGDNSAEQISLENEGFTTTIMATTGRTLTPVQFLSVNDRMVISGAFTLDREPSSGDSISPVINALKTDLIHAAKCLR